jgi:hypothetical protein
MAMLTSRAMVGAVSGLLLLALGAVAVSPEGYGCRSRDSKEFIKFEQLDTRVFRMTWDLLPGDLIHLAQCLVLIAIFDVVFAMHTKARWFVLHLIANSFVVASALPDVLATVGDPANSVR